MKIITPKFIPRPYQRKIMKDLLVNDYKRMIVLAHRRSGKDVCSLNMLWMMALQRPGLYLHLLPKIGQSTTAIWKGRGKDGVSFLDYIPSQIRAKDDNNSTQTITLTNGSIIKVTGADNYSTLIGSNPMGIIYSEIQSTNPLAWEYLRPALTESGGWAIFIGTARGHNHFYDLYTKNLNNPKWAVYKQTVDDTTYEDGRRVITQEMLDDELESGMSQELVNQEYFCSFEGAIQGAFFIEQMKSAHEEGRICSFDIDVNLPCHTAWDIGISDATSIGLYQAYPDGSVRNIYHIEEVGKGAEYFMLQLRLVKDRLGLKRWGHHFFPHDISVREWGAGGRSRTEVMQKGGFFPKHIRRSNPSARVQVIRSLFPRLWIHEGNCKHVLRAIQEYHSEYNEEKRVFSTTPVHNWASHCVDQLGHFALGYLDSYDRVNLDRQMKYASFMP